MLILKTGIRQNVSAMDNAVYFLKKLTLIENSGITLSSILTHILTLIIHILSSLKHDIKVISSSQYSDLNKHGLKIW